MKARVKYDFKALDGPCHCQAVGWEAIRMIQIEDGKTKTGWVATDQLSMSEQPGKSLGLK